MDNRPITFDETYTEAMILQTVPRLPVLSSLKTGWDNLLLYKYHLPPHQTPEHRITWHTLTLTMGERPVRFERRSEGRSIKQCVTAGNINIYPQNQALTLSWDREVEFVQLYLNPTFVSHLAYETINPDRIELTPQFVITDPLMQQLLLTLYAELNSNQPPSHLLAEAAAVMLSLRLLKQYSTLKPAIFDENKQLNRQRLMPVLDYIDTHLKQPIRLVDLAQLSGMSLFHFSRMFKQAIGKTPYQYILEQRIDRARQLLKQPDRTLTDIALDCGFSSQSHFTRYFRQLMGVTPDAYRRSI